LGTLLGVTAFPRFVLELVCVESSVGVARDNRRDLDFKTGMVLLYILIYELDASSIN
jgi:hypothetical protein